jgi:hypothetical protein
LHSKVTLLRHCRNRQVCPKFNMLATKPNPHKIHTETNIRDGINMQIEKGLRVNKVHVIRWSFLDRRVYIKHSFVSHLSHSVNVTQFSH